MRFAIAHGVALAAFACVLFVGFAVTAGLNADASASLGFRVQLDRPSYGIAVLYSIYIGPVALIGLLGYFAVLRARPAVPWVAVSASLAHHLVYHAFRPRLLPDVSAHG